jgi:hypothetical protein
VPTWGQELLDMYDKRQEKDAKKRQDRHTLVDSLSMRSKMVLNVELLKPLATRASSSSSYLALSLSGPK